MPRRNITVPPLLGGEEGKNNAWTKPLISRIVDLKEQCRGYMWVHRENSIYLQDIYEWISVLSFSMSFFNGAVLIFPTNIIYIRILNILLSFLAGLLVFYIKNKQLTEEAERHKLASSKFSAIANNIDRQLSLPIHLRENGLHYHRWITLQFDTLYGSTPDIDPPIIEEYKKKFAKRRKIHPVEAADLDQTSDSTSTSSSSHGKDKEDDINPQPLNDDSSTEDNYKPGSDTETETETDEDVEKGSHSEKNKGDGGEVPHSPDMRINPDVDDGSISSGIEDEEIKRGSKRGSERDNTTDKLVKKASKANLVESTRNKKKERLIDYEMQRMERNMQQAMYQMNMSAPTNKCYLNHFANDDIA